MKNFKNEISILIVGGILILFSFINMNNSFTDVDTVDTQKDLIKLNASLESKNRAPSSANKSLPTSEEQDSIKVKRSIASKKAPKNLDAIQKIIICLDSEECHYANTDPREYALEVHQDVSRNLKEALGAWTKNWSSFSFSEQEEIIALFKLDSGYVKEDMLNFLNTLPKEDSKIYYETVVSEVLKYHDANLINESMEYLKNIKDPSNEVEISKDIVSVIATGSPHVAGVLSKHSAAFISESTKEIFSELASNLPENSPEVIHVNAAIIEYEMVSSGG